MTDRDEKITPEIDPSPATPVLEATIHEHPNNNQQQVTIFNIANAITLVRLVIGVLVIGLLYGNEKTLSILLYLVFLILDLLDGMAARKWKCVTTFGNNFDLITDAGIGFLLAACLLIKGLIPLPYIILSSVPLCLFALATYEGRTISKNPFIPAKWRTLNGQVAFLIILLFIVNHRGSIIGAYLLLIYIYVSRIKHLIEVYQLKKATIKQ